MADVQSIDVMGTTLTREMFPSDEEWNKVVTAAQRPKDTQVEQSWSEKQEIQRQEAEQERQEALARGRAAGITYREAPKEEPKEKVLTAAEADELAKTKAELATLQAERVATSPQVQVGEQAPEGEQAGEGPTINIQTAPTGISPGMTRETVINQVMQSPQAKEAVKLYQDATEASIKANQEKIGFETARANEAAALKESALKDLEAMDAENKARDQRVVEEMNMQQARMRQAQEQLSNYKFQDFFQGRDGARVMAGISIALGAVGSALTKGPNYALEIINNAIDNDLAQQQANYNKLKGTFEGEQTLYGQLKQRRLDDLQAFQIAKKTRLDQAALQVEAASEKVSDAEAKNRATMIANALRQEGAKAMMAATEGLKTTVQTQIKAAPGMAPKDIIDSRAAFEKRVNEGPLGAAMQAELALRKFRDIVKAGASEAALVDFVASKGGLQQGSVAMEFVNGLNKMGLADMGMDTIRGWVKGGSAPILIKKIENFLDAASKRATDTAVKHLPPLMQEAKLVGLDFEPYMQDLNRAQLQSVMLRRQGGRRANP